MSGSVRAALHFAFYATVCSLLLLVLSPIPLAAQASGGRSKRDAPEVSNGSRSTLAQTTPNRPEVLISPPSNVTLPTPILPPARPEIIRYNRTWYALYFVGIAWDIAGLLLLLRLRAAQRFLDGADALFRWSTAWLLCLGATPGVLAWISRLLHAAVVVAGISLLLLVWNLPLGLFGYGIERAYGFATLSPGRWLTDRGLGWLIGLQNIFAVWACYWLLERSPKRWWLWLWLASIPWTLALTVLYPILIAPRYNDFRLLPDSPLRHKLVALAHKAGIDGAEVYAVDISKRTKKLNAYVTGLGPTKRMVLWDTTLTALSEDEIMAIMGHEIGHYVKGHIWRNFVVGIGGAFVILWLMSRLLPWLVEKKGTRWGIRSPHDLAGLPLMLLLAHIILTLQTPLASALSRYNEHEADRYGLELTGLNNAMAHAFITFVQRDFADPDPPRFLVFWFYTHPPLRERVDFALQYHPPQEE